MSKRAGRLLEAGDEQGIRALAIDRRTRMRLSALGKPRDNLNIENQCRANYRHEPNKLPL